MSNDGLFTTHIYNVHLPSLKSRIGLRPFGDVHRNSDACDKGRWKDFLEDGKTDLDSLYLCLGDLSDFASSSGQSKIKSIGLHGGEIKSLDGYVMTIEDQLYDEIGFMGDKLIGIVTGNHNWTYETDPEDEEGVKGKTFSEHLAERMGTIALGDFAYIRLRFTFGDTTKKANIDIVACHGRAGGKLSGTSVNQVAELTQIFPVADLYFMGHDHQKWIHPHSSMTAFSNKKGTGLIIKQKSQLLVRSGSFLKVFQPGVPSYMVKRYKKPAELGVVKLDLGFKRSRAGGTDMLFPDIKGIV